MKNAEPVYLSGDWGESHESEEGKYPNATMIEEEIAFNTSTLFNKDVFKIILFLSETTHISYSKSELLGAGAVLDFCEKTGDYGNTLNYFYTLPKWDIILSAKTYEQLVRFWIAKNFDKMNVLLNIIGR